MSESISVPFKVPAKRGRKPKEVKLEVPLNQQPPAQPAPAKKERKPRAPKTESQEDRQALAKVHNFVKVYLSLAEADDAGHEANETKLIEGLLDIYDPPQSPENTDAIQSL